MGGDMNTDVPYDLLLDDELNGFFDDDDAISTTTDEGELGAYSLLDQKNSVDSDNRDVATTAGTDEDTPPTDATSATSGRNEVDMQQYIRGVAPTALTGHQQQECTNNDHLLACHDPSNKSIDIYPFPLKHAHQQHPSTSTLSIKNNLSSVVVNERKSITMDELNVDEIVIDGVEPTLVWHNEQIDRHHRQAMIGLMYVVVTEMKTNDPNWETI